MAEGTFEYPRVSDILSKQNANAMRAIPLDVLVSASIRGTAIHRYCTAHLKKLFFIDIEPDYQVYFDAFVEWADEHIEKVYDTEVRLFDHTLRYTGEYDIRAKLKNREGIYLIDIKTSCAPYKTWPLQLAAYKNLCDVNEILVDHAMVVHLKKKKPTKKQLKLDASLTIAVDSKEIPLEDATLAWDIFSSALKCYDYFDRKEPKKKKEKSNEKI